MTMRYSQLYVLYSLNPAGVKLGFKKEGDTTKPAFLSYRQKRGGFLLVLHLLLGL